MAAHPFVHGTYGESSKTGFDAMPDITQLRAVQANFLRAMNGFPLAVTNHLAKASIVSYDISHLYEWPLYQRVNADILSAGGIAGILSNGQSEDGSTFASAQVSIQTATSRIEAARHEVEDFINKLNVRIAEDIAVIHKNNLKEPPKFHFMPFDFSG